MAATGGGPATPDLTPVDVMIGDIIGTELVEGVVPVEEGDSDVRETQTSNEPGKSQFQSVIRHFGCPVRQN